MVRFVLGLSALLLGACSTSPDIPDSSVTDAGDGGCFSGFCLYEASAYDTWVDWCEAGPPKVVGTDKKCSTYKWVPCGLPTGVSSDDAGNINYCDGICYPGERWQCELLDPAFVDNLVEAGLLDASDTADAGDGGYGLGVYISCDCYG